MSSAKAKPKTARSQTSTSANARRTKVGSASAKQSAGRKVPASPSHRSNAAELLPDEVLLHLFSYLDANDLLIVARVCKRWLSIANDNVLWKKMYGRYLAKTKAGKNLGIPLETPTLWWKKQCVNSSVQFRNERAMNKLNALDPFTLMPKNYTQNLKDLGVRYTLAFLDRSGTHHYIRHNDCFHHRMSLTARWYNFEGLPAPARLQSVKLLALNPVFYDQKGVACKHSPCQRSLLCDMEFNMGKVTAGKPLASDSSLNIYLLRPGIAVATWKDGGGIAFIAANLHYNNLIERCLHGSFKQAHSYENQSLSTQQIRLSAAYSTNATVELRNMRNSLWSEKFLNVCGDGVYSLILIHPERRSEHRPIEKNIELPWKTDLFKNKIPDLCIMDMVIRDGNGRINFAICDFVVCVSNDQAKVSYDYDDQGRLIQHDIGARKLTLTVDKDPESENQVVSGLTIR